jgi:UDP-N-acetylmuramoylalanine--D-glutamate ligase
VVGDIELFARAVRAPVIGITGTNGKSTVTSLVASMAAPPAARARRRQSRRAGARSAGSARPICTCSNCRAFSWRPPPRSSCSAAVVLNVTADHMDRYASLEDYARAKARIFARAATVVLNADDPLVAAMRGGRRRARARDVTFSTVERGDADFTLMRRGDADLAGASRRARCSTLSRA